jgi:hypothetical protein
LKERVQQRLQGRPQQPLEPALARETKPKLILKCIAAASIAHAHEICSAIEPR